MFTVKRADENKHAKLAAMPMKTPWEIEAEAEARRRKKFEYQREWQRRRKQASKNVQTAVACIE